MFKLIIYKPNHSFDRELSFETKEAAIEWINSNYESGTNFPWVVEKIIEAKPPDPPEIAAARAKIKELKGKNLSNSEIKDAVEALLHLIKLP